MPDLVHLDFAKTGAGCVALPFEINFPTWADAYAWLTAHGYESQDKSNALWERAR